MAATNELMHHLTMAACEWFLMFLMFIYAALGFILTRFAHRCKLQTPCLFCFRFDHVFGVEESSFYSTHFCSKHRAVMSIMKRSGSMKEGKMGIKGSCCKRQWKQKPRGLGLIKLGVPNVIMNRSLLRITGWARPARCRYHYRNNFKKGRDKISGNTSSCHVGDNIHVDTFSDSGCVDLRLISGSESEDSFCEIECQNEGSEDESRVVTDQGEHSNSVSDPEPSLFNGPLNGSITGNASLTSNGHEVKESGSFNQDLPSNIDNDEGYESPGEHNVGESDIEKLKRQVEYGQEQLRLLHVELEEERNANAIAVDEVMAMITRLQDEKASLHMEALQYSRMMDEQAEYDMEALDKAHDLITEKDKQIQDLEDELEFYKTRLDEFKNNHLENGKNNHPVLDLEDEKNHILWSLSELERKFHHFSNGNIVENGLSPRNETDRDTLENEIFDLNERLDALESVA